jgi:hypothetical protein
MPISHETKPGQADQHHGPRGGQRSSVNPVFDVLSSTAYPMNQPLGPPRQQPVSNELATALSACRRAFLAIARFSGMSNVLMLAGALFMLEVYDRVLPSRSVPTLVGLLLLVAFLYAAQGVIDMIRSRSWAISYLCKKTGQPLHWLIGSICSAVLDGSQPLPTQRGDAIDNFFDLLRGVPRRGLRCLSHHVWTLPTSGAFPKKGRAPNGGTRLGLYEIGAGGDHGDESFALHSTIVKHRTPSDSTGRLN